jgi:hypothetical protein
MPLLHILVSRAWPPSESRSYGCSQHRPRVPAPGERRGPRSMTDEELEFHRLNTRVECGRHTHRSPDRGVVGPRPVQERVVP